MQQSCRVCNWQRSALAAPNGAIPPPAGPNQPHWRKRSRQRTQKWVRSPAAGLKRTPEDPKSPRRNGYAQGALSTSGHSRWPKPRRNGYASSFSRFASATERRLPAVAQQVITQKRVRPAPDPSSMPPRLGEYLCASSAVMQRRNAETGTPLHFSAGPHP